MFNFFYQRYKVWFWLLLTLLFASGAVSKAYHASLWEVILNAVLGVVSLFIFIHLSLRKNAVDSQAKEIKTGRLVVLFTSLGLFASIVMLPYQQELGLLQSLSDRYSISQPVAAVLSVVQTTIMSLIASYIGLLLYTNVKLGAPLLENWVYRAITPKFSAKWFVIAVLGSLLGTLIVSMLEVNVFQPQLPDLASDLHIDLWKSVLVLFYGGIVEEILLRLFILEKGFGIRNDCSYVC